MKDSKQPIYMMQFTAFLLLTSFVTSPASANSVTDFCNGFNAQEFVDELIPANDLLTVTNFVYTGACGASGLVKFDDETNYIAYTLQIGETALVLTSGSLNTSMSSENKFDGKTTWNDAPGDTDLDNLLSDINHLNCTISQTHDASVIEFDIVSSISARVSFEYIFASDEYNEYVGHIFNDVFAFWINGENVATINGTFVSINNVNKYSLSQYYISNDYSDLYSYLDGYCDGIYNSTNGNTSNSTFYGDYCTDYYGGGWDYYGGGLTDMLYDVYCNNDYYNNNNNTFTGSGSSVNSSFTTEYPYTSSYSNYTSGYTDGINNSSTIWDILGTLIGTGSTYTDDNGEFNSSQLLPTEYDGLTVLLSTAEYHIEAGETYHVKLAISDTGDNAWDSAVFLKPGSFQVVADETFTVDVGTDTDNSTTNVNSSTSDSVNGTADVIIDDDTPEIVQTSGSAKSVVSVFVCSVLMMCGGLYAL